MYEKCPPQHDNVKRVIMDNLRLTALVNAASLPVELHGPGPFITNAYNHLAVEDGEFVKSMGSPAPFIEKVAQLQETATTLFHRRADVLNLSITDIVAKLTSTSAKFPEFDFSTMPQYIQTCATHEKTLSQLVAQADVIKQAVKDDGIAFTMDESAICPDFKAAMLITQIWFAYATQLAHDVVSSPALSTSPLWLHVMPKHLSCHYIVVVPLLLHMQLATVVSHPAVMHSVIIFVHPCIDSCVLFVPKQLRCQLSCH
jgi:hypothetical protein